jgi:hypothetical protein
MLAIDREAYLKALSTRLIIGCTVSMLIWRVKEMSWDEKSTVLQELRTVRDRNALTVEQYAMLGYWAGLDAEALKPFPVFFIEEGGKMIPHQFSINYKSDAGEEDEPR